MHNAQSETVEQQYEVVRTRKIILVAKVIIDYYFRFIINIHYVVRICISLLLAWYFLKWIDNDYLNLTIR